MAGSLDEARFLRQMLLPEVGVVGQALIQRGSAAVGGQGLANDVAIRYVRTAGIGTVTDGAIDVDLLAPPAVCAYEPSRAVVAGARAALAELRAALGRDRYAPRNDVPETTS